MNSTKGLTEEQSKEVESLLEKLELNLYKVDTYNNLREMLQVYKDCVNIMEEIIIYEDIVKEFQLKNKGEDNGEN